MPRTARTILDNVCYHVITRGIDKKNVFMDEADFEEYICRVLRYKDRYDSRIYGWCFMNNHVHMVISSENLSKLMHGINLSYAKYFRHRYKGAGYLWQDRFKSYIVQKDEYLINCISYIELNPVRAKIVLRPEDYKWSSYKARILGERDRLLDPLTL